MKKILLLSMYATILVVQDYLLSFIPNIQLSMLLVVLLASLFKWHEAIVVSTVYVLLDNLFFGGFGIYTIPMLLSWYGVIVAVKLLKPDGNSSKKIALFSILFSVWYAIPFMMFSIFLYDLNLISYIVADIPFWILMGMSSYISIDLLYAKLYRFLLEGEFVWVYTPKLATKD